VTDAHPPAPYTLSLHDALPISGKSAALKLGTLAAHEREKLVARLLIVTESAEHGASDGLSMLFFHAAHLHAEMAGFDNHADTLRGDFFLDGLRDLAGQALLNLQAA